jgi:hypothetical protein
VHPAAATLKQTDKQRTEGTETKRTRKKRRSGGTALPEDYVPPDYRQTSHSSEAMEAIRYSLVHVLVFSFMLTHVTHCRQGWDVFAVPKEAPGASAIPPDMLRAAAPSSLEWERHLKQRPPHLPQPAATNAHRRHSHHHRKHPPPSLRKGTSVKMSSSHALS